MNVSTSERHALSSELRALREENLTLYGAINVVSSSLELEPMLQRVVDLATDATDCHACFIYLLEDDQLTIRAASPVYAEAVGRVRFSVREGLTGWVARHRTPEFIRDRAMNDPRMKFVPLLDEESFQSMAAVPILSRAGQTIGVIVLHTQAPHEFGDDVLKLLVHIGSLVSGAIENAQLYDRERRRLDTMTGLSQLTQRVAAATGAELGEIIVAETAALLGAAVCQLLRLDADGDSLTLQASVPDDLGPPSTGSAAELTLAALHGRDGGGRRQALWPRVPVSDVLVVPLTAGERVGLLCVATEGGDGFGSEDAELARAIAHLAAVAIKRAELIEGLTTANAIKDLFEALASGASEFAADKAAELRCDLTSAYVMLSAEPAGAGDRSSGLWRTAAEELGGELERLAPHAAVEAGPGPVRALLSFAGAREVRSDELLGRARELGQRTGAAIGISEFRRAPADAAGAYREARDATTIARALLPDGGAIDYSRVGAYRYLVQIAADDAPRDRMRTAVDTLIDYDRRRSTALLDTLERYLAERRSVIESARALYIHPNTLRQRLGRIEELTGLDLGADDLLSLELAIKLARLHGRPDAGRG
ncbi:MAG TPA: GAF domain-containing protein [Solirubrobacteraceae bacterium]|nr:GAF domain-containing protein [Solirubrobacteraceae bacterium]